MIAKRAENSSPPDRTLDPGELRLAFSSRTKAIILDSPNNATGKVFTTQELGYIAQRREEFDALAITDEIYEHILYEAASHIAIAIFGRNAGQKHPGKYDE